MSPFSFITQATEIRQSQGRLRSLRDVTPLTGSRVMIKGQELLNLSSNDFLGLSEHPLLAQRAAEYASEYGAGLA